MVSFTLLLYSATLVLLLIWVSNRHSMLSIYPLTLFYMLAEVPFLFISYKYPSILYQSALAWVDDIENTYILHVSLRVIFLVCFSCVCLFYKTKASLNQRRIKIKLRYLVFLLIVILASYLSFLSQVGGLALILANMSTKTELIRGSGITRLLFVYSTMLLASVSVCWYADSDQSILKKIFLFLLMISMFLLLASYGERKNSIVFILIFVMSWHVWVKPLSLFSFKALFAMSILIAFSSLAPPLRESGAAVKYALEPTMLFYDAIPHLGELFRRFSDIDVSIFMLNYFNDYDRYFFLSTLPNFFTGFIPSFLYPGKPPLDEAVVVYNLASGVNPGVYAPFENFIPVGWPLSRYTSGWVQFGISGVFLYSFATSFLLVMFNNFTMKNNSPFVLPLYVNIASTGLGISNAYIFNLLIAIAVILMLYCFYRVLTILSRS
jgi:hypothetical protein